MCYDLYTNKQVIFFIHKEITLFLPLYTEKTGKSVDNSVNLCITFINRSIPLEQGHSFKACVKICYRWGFC